MLGGAGNGPQPGLGRAQREGPEPALLARHLAGLPGGTPVTRGAVAPADLECHGPRKECARVPK